MIELQTVQGKLFDELPGYRFHLLVANMSGSTRAIRRFYKERSNIENMIKETVYDLNFKDVPTARFYSNADHFFILFFAYNILFWHERLVLRYRAAKHLMASRIRRYFNFVVAKMVYHAKTIFLALQDDYPFKNYFYQHQKRINGRAPLN